MNQPPPLQKESCVFCDNSGLEILIPSDVLPSRVKVLKCRQCGLVFLESRNEKNEMDREENAYWDGDSQKKIYLEDKIEKIFIHEFKKRLARMTGYLPSKGQLLDVGCGVGHFLVCARSEGWQTEGLDISREAQRTARESYGIEVEVGTLEDAPLEAGKFDAMTLWDVIEHIRRPIENMKAANRLLRMGGLLAMKTPDENSMLKGIALSCYRLFGKRAAFLLKYVYYVPHYFSYTRKTIEMLIQRAGFELVRAETDTTPYQFAVGKLNIHYRKDPKRFLVILFLPLVQFISRIFKKGNKMIVYARKVREVEGNRE